MSAPLKGVIAAIATPVDAAGEPDLPRYLKLARHLLDNGCDALNILGTTGEATSFSLAQRKRVMSALKDAGLPMNRLMVGTGAASIADAEDLTKHAASLGFAGALIIPPFYYKGISNAGMVRFFERLAKATADTPVPLYLYHFPTLSGVPYTPSLVADLLAAFGSRVVGLKDSSGDMEYARGIARTHPGFAVFPSNEATLMEARTGIFAGCISATANLNSAWCGKGFHQGDEKALATAVAIRKMFDGKVLISGVKATLAHIHKDAAFAAPLPPMVTCDAAEQAHYAAEYDRLAAG
ncbi:dihydrodipicolinate synthase family protein [Alsobacter sp. R-9]